LQRVANNYGRYLINVSETLFQPSEHFFPQLVLKFSSRCEGWKMHGRCGHATSRIRVDGGIGLSKVSDP